ncbi:Zn-ribbon domain-containing OB-fold protein [Blastococcus goldschmidtiae]|uniref:OB-fold domain-containing protein n=1 Tax=Blastococcus goldschmidtiae TaxID=3075546 RepID=A0ABU2K7K1_9ACTN|nr:OB-fold domain-containing protein [Blastococcus sp. DSM 46792]MDT0276148.1 OB-fold domain-containing protein [Blastococcus sp. DSM 46792]
MPGPSPLPTPETAPYWEGAAAGELRVQQCTSCTEHYFYPRPFCPRCGSDDVAWKATSGRATLVSYVINHRPLPPSDGPLVIALVQLEEGPRMMSNVVGVEPTPEQLPLGMPLRVIFEERGEYAIPVFTPAEAAR